MSLAGRATNAPADWSPFTHKTISVQEAADAAGVATKTIWRWCAQDRIRFARAANGRLRIYRETLFHVPRENAQSETSATSSEHRGEANAE
jgi:excisionase family DNA binding protein